MKDNNIEMINISPKKQIEVINVNGKQIKRTRVNNARKEEYINLKVSKNKLKKSIRNLIILLCLMLAAKYGIDFYKDYQVAEQQKQEFINDIVENDPYLDDLEVYVSDSGSEVWEKNNETGLQEPVRNEDVADYINNMDITEEEKDILASYFGVQRELSSTHKKQ